MTLPDTNEIRAKALSFAMELSRPARSARKIVEDAAVFETYLLNGSPPALTTTDPPAKPRKHDGP